MKSLNFKEGVKENTFFHKIAFSMKELLFPSFGKCPSCGKVLLSEEFICEKCEEAMQKPVYFCTVCGRVTEEIGVCVNCAVNPPLWNRCVSSFTYTSPADTLIHEMKYRNYPDIAKHLGKFLAEDILRKTDCANTDFITFVPSSEDKMTQRGYNQAQLLADAVGNILNIPVKDILSDNGESVHQVGLSGTRRAENAAGRYSLKEGVSVEGKRIIIIDDVITTGATMRACIGAINSGGKAAHITAASVCQTISEIKK